MPKNNEKQMQRFDDLVMQVNNLPLDQVIGRNVDLVQHGQHFYGLCPFHPDHKIGSFVVTPSRNLWKCFTDGRGGNGISFEMQYYRIDFHDAVLKLALDFGLISHTEFEFLSNKRFDPKALERVQRRLDADASKRMCHNKRADSDVLNAVYRAMAEVCGLTPRHRKHLLCERGLKEEDLPSYFSFPNKRIFPVTKRDFLETGEILAKRFFNQPLKELTHDQIAKINGICQETEKKGAYSLSFSTVSTLPAKSLSLASKIIRYLGLQEAKKLTGNKDVTPLDLSLMQVQEINVRLAKIRQQFPRIPGFYVNAQGHVDYISYSGIGILCPDEKGRIQGVQVRRDTIRNGEARYIWMSSSFAETNPEYKGGASSGSPGGFIPAAKGSKNHRPSICITEGRFKAEQIAKKGNDAIYVSGVSTWKSVLPMLRKVKNGRSTVYVMFDADAMGNVAVHKQLSAMSQELLKEGFLTKLILWPKEYGKGFDDLVLNEGNHYSEHLKAVSFTTFEQQYQKALIRVLNEYGVKDVRSIDQDKIKNFTDGLQSEVERSVGVS